MSNLRLLLFDMDGVLVNTISLLKQSYCEVARYLELPHPPEEQLIQSVLMSSNQALRYLFPQYKENAHTIFSQCWRNNSKFILALPGIRELLQKLTMQNLKLGVVTSRNRSDTNTFLKAIQLLSFFSIIITWGDYRVAKPSPACLLAALSLAKVDASYSAYIGDQAIDIQAAKRAGLISIGATWDPNADKKLLEAAHPDFMADSPKAVYDLFY